MMILGYWDVRGIGHPIRLLLEYTATPYEEKRYVFGDDYDKSQWLDEKDNLGLDFPNLPYLFDGDIKLTQSNTIMRYIARKHGLCANSESEKNIESMLENEAMDFRMRLIAISYNPKFEELKGPYLEKLPTVLARYSKFFGERHWFLGDKITFVDFLMYDVLDQHNVLDPTCLQKFKNLQDFHARFEVSRGIQCERSQLYSLAETEYGVYCHPRILIRLTGRTPAPNTEACLGDPDLVLPQSPTHSPTRACRFEETRTSHTTGFLDVRSFQDVEALPAIAAYMKTPLFNRNCINAITASWANK